MPAKYAIELVLLAAIWGASFMFMRIATPEFGPVALIEIRVLVASLFLLPIWYLREGRAGRTGLLAKSPHLIVIGLLNSAAPFVLFAYATLHITGGFASILNATAPIWGALVAWVWLKKGLSRDGVSGLLLGLIGVVILVSDSLSFTQHGISLGIAAAAFAAFLYGIAANYTSEKLADISPLAIATFSQIAAVIILLPAVVWFFPDKAISIKAWISVIVLGVVCTGMAYVMYFRLIAHVGSTRAITVTFLIPVFGTLWGALFIDEQVTLEMVIGTAVILLGTALVTGVISLRKHKAESPVNRARP